MSFFVIFLMDLLDVICNQIQFDCWLVWTQECWTAAKTGLHDYTNMSLQGFDFGKVLKRMVMVSFFYILTNIIMVCTDTHHVCLLPYLLKIFTEKQSGWPNMQFVDHLVALARISFPRLDDFLIAPWWHMNSTLCSQLHGVCHWGALLFLTGMFLQLPSSTETDTSAPFQKQHH